MRHLPRAASWRARADPLPRGRAPAGAVSAEPGPRPDLPSPSRRGGAEPSPDVRVLSRAGHLPSVPRGAASPRLHPRRRLYSPSRAGGPREPTAVQSLPHAAAVLLELPPAHGGRPEQRGQPLSHSGLATLSRPQLGFFHGEGGGLQPARHPRAQERRHLRLLSSGARLHAVPRAAPGRRARPEPPRTGVPRIPPLPGDAPAEPARLPQVPRVPRSAHEPLPVAPSPRSRADP